MAPSTRRRSSTRRTATSSKDADDLEMSKENVMNEEEPAAMSEDENDLVASGTPKKKTVKTKKSTTKKKTPASSDSPKKTKVKGSSKTENEPADMISESEDDEKSPTKKKAPKKKRATKKKQKGDDGSGSDSEGSPKKKRKSPAKKKKEPHQRVTERIELPKLWDAKEALDKKGSYTYKIASWNVAGLRAVLRKDPDSLARLCKKHDLDMLCLQETKLQETHLDDPKLLKLSNSQVVRDVLSEEGYDSFWSCSTVKKGYSGTAVFTKKHGSKKSKQKSISSFFQTKKTKKKDDVEDTTERADGTNDGAELPISADLLKPEDVSYDIGQEIDGEGRVVMVNFPFASIANVYVPNSGQKLERLTYRTDEWDDHWLNFMQKRQEDRGKPVIWLGDLNIAHQAQDVWNDGAKHLATQAGVTPQERASFQKQLDSGFVDAFRKLHPDAQAHYSYWSMRAGNREPNKGLRLDYFICSPELFSEDSDVVVRDSYMIYDQYGSDHCPVVLELEIKKD